MVYQPRLDKNGIYNNPYWYSQNIFNANAPLPNCTAYAWGRWLELGYPVNDLGIGDGNAQNWYPNTLNKGILQCSQTPALGAIACWTRGDGKRGHVGVVEIIDPNGNITVSMSGWVDFDKRTYPIYNMQKYFWLEAEPYSNDPFYRYRCPKWMFAYDNNGNYLPNMSYTLQGFILPPNVETLDWMHAEVDYDPVNVLPANYKENNARIIYGIFSALGWYLEPICGMLGNMENEGNLQPGQCENNRGLPLYDPNTGIPTNPYYLPNMSENYGLGLCGWTSWNIPQENIVLKTAIDQGKPWYDGNMQCNLVAQADTMGYWNPDPTKGYPGTFDQYKTNSYNRSVEDLASTFLWAYEHPYEPDAHEDRRRADARKWYNYLQNAGPVNPPFDPGMPSQWIKKMPIWMMIRYH